MIRVCLLTHLLLLQYGFVMGEGNPYGPLSFVLPAVEPVATFTAEAAAEPAAEPAAAKVVADSGGHALCKRQRTNS